MALFMEGVMSEANYMTRRQMMMISHCPYCGAGWGDPCFRADGKERKSLHRARVLVAQKDFKRKRKTVAIHEHLERSGNTILKPVSLPKPPLA